MWEAKRNWPCNLIAYRQCKQSQCFTILQQRFVFVYNSDFLHRRERGRCRTVCITQVESLQWIIISYTHPDSTVQQSEDKGKQVLSPCQKFARKFSVSGKSARLQLVLAKLKAEDTKEINRQQVQECSKLDSFFYVICMVAKVLEDPRMKTLEENTKLGNPANAENKVLQYFRSKGSM